MTRVTGSDYAVMFNLINTHHTNTETYTHIHRLEERSDGPLATIRSKIGEPSHDAQTTSIIFPILISTFHCPQKVVAGILLAVRD